MENREDKIRTLRLLMKQNGVDVLILPQSDPHIGEEIPDHWKIIQWLTGFSGSAATVIVTESFAGLWTDSRYFIQAEEQLAGSGFEFMRPGSLIPADYVEWLREHIIAGSRIGFDGKIFPVREFRRLKDTLKAMDVEFAADSDPVKSIWVDRPPLPSSMVWDHQLSFAGKDRAAKISMVRRAMKERNLDMHLLTSPADIMWMLNIRGSDLQFTPVSFCYALVENDGILLFIDRDKIGQDLLPDLSAHGVEILQYGEIAETLSSGKDSGSLLLSPSTLSVAVYDSVPGKINIVEDESIPSVLKAVKNRVEIENISSVMVKDGFALTRFIRWLEEGSRDADLTEQELCEKLRELRSEQDDYLGPSYSTIAAYN
jgi:Xaa-Pro aminopeptidase